MNKKILVPILMASMVALSACTLGIAPQATPTVEPIATSSINLAEAPEDEIVHELVPISLPAERENHAADHDSSKTASRKHPPGGDRFTFGEFERPFNANSMDVYFPYLDIVDTQVFADDTWLYATLTLRGTDEDGQLPGEYYVEIDQNRDGRGDWLVGVTAPNSSEWTSEGVQVWHDSNDDIGGDSAFTGEDNPPYSDGFELLVYDQGQGEKKDAAFARIDSGQPHVIQFAVQYSLFEGDRSLLVGMWTGNDLNPAEFDLNDHFNHEQAGAANPGYEYFYPIKEIAEMDNSCRVPVGFEPSGSEPGLCPSAAPPGSPGAPGAPPDRCEPPIWCDEGDWNYNTCECELI